MKKIHPTHCICVDCEADRHEKPDPRPLLVAAKRAEFMAALDVPKEGRVRNMHHERWAFENGFVRGMECAIAAICGDADPESINKAWEEFVVLPVPDPIPDLGRKSPAAPEPGAAP